ncbi:hypothetical protein MM300_00440 [Evansella sp. LMS18]|uniref:DUF6115 domain-containing protein n=1 Tax=Evansella sp. LMS18 TaxID=2924033 RepID=UPI0020D07998|nr:hypothetical protein [Evansella sp. LMS18]UTR10841.1 hypothetical protein MM300_00440 [Evansella sp. LMS18]
MLYLLIISFLLHLVCFYFIILLYQRLKHQEPFDKEKTLNEMEEMLLAYTTEMKENNEKIARIVSRKLNSQSAGPKPEDRSTDAGPDDYGREQEGPEGEILAFHAEQKEYTPPLPDEEKAVSVDTSPQSRVLSLHNEGYTINEIARKLNMGTGEVELLIKFYK